MNLFAAYYWFGNGNNIIILINLFIFTRQQTNDYYKKT